MNQYTDSDTVISFLSKFEYMNPSYRSSMEDTVVIEPALKNDPNIFFAALMDGHGGWKMYLGGLSCRMCNSILCCFKIVR